MLNKIVLSSFCSFALATQAWAETAAHGEPDGLHSDSVGIGHAVDEATHTSSGGLPQFDPTWFASQIFWLAICFAVMYLFFARKTLPDISSVIENRKNHIQADLETAEKLTAEADSVQEAYQKNLTKAQNDAVDEIKKVEDKSKETAEQAMEVFRNKSESAIKETEQQIEISKIKAMDDMNQIAVEAAAQAVEKIIGTAPDKTKVQSVIDGMNGKAKAA